MAKSIPMRSKFTTTLVAALIGATLIAGPARAEKPPINFAAFKTGHANHFAVLRKIGGCFKKLGVRKKMLAVLKDRNTRFARRLRDRCISKADIRALQAAPTNYGSLSGGGGNRTSGATTPPSGYYKSMSWGFGPSAAAFWGFTLDGGFIWNLNGYGPVRPYFSSAKGKGFQLNFGADPVIFNLYRAAVATGVSRSSVFVASAEPGISVTPGMIYDSTKPANDALLGLMVAFGVGTGGNLGSIYRVKTRIFRTACRKVQVTVTNSTGVKVKIIDLDYYDYGKRKWRSEPTPNKKVAAGGVWRKTRNLEKIDSEDTQIRIKYRKRRSGGLKRWSKIKKAYSSTSYCEKYSSYAVELKR